MSATQVAVYALTRIELARIVKAPRDRVFEAITDYESWPEFSKLFTRVTVTERTEGRWPASQKGTGPEPPTFIGHAVLRLTTVGAKTGRERLNALHSFPDGEDSWLIVAAKFGAVDHPGWFYNLARNPDKVWVQVGNRCFRAKVETLPSAEREEACARLAKTGSHIADLQKKTDRQIPVVRVWAAGSES